MIPVDDILVSNDIATACFACDLEACKGACCTIPGGTGAPLNLDELPYIEKAAVDLFHMLTWEARDVIRRRGAYESVGRDNFVTMCIADKECVFVIYDDGIAKCAIQQAYHQGAFEWEKPISCHLFPIRINSFGTTEALNYEPISACQPAIRRGKRKQLCLDTFLRIPLVRKYGASWYLRFLAACKQKRHDLGYDDDNRHPVR